MESYCVIRFKDKQQKQQVLMQLMENDLDLTLTTDLKKFLSEKYNVNAPENFTPMDKDQESLFKRSPANSMERSIVTGSASISIVPGTQSINGTNQLAQYSTVHPSTASNIGPQLHPSNTNPPAFVNMEDYGKYTPYLERPAVPKEEEVEDQDIGGQDEDMMIDSTDNSNDSPDNRPADVDIMPNEVETPSSSTKQKPSRNTSRPNYAINADSDDDDDVDEMSIEDQDIGGQDEDSLLDLSDDEMISNDSPDNQPADVDFMPVEVETPSSSTARRSSRNTSRPNYSIEVDSDDTSSCESSNESDQESSDSTDSIPVVENIIHNKVKASSSLNTRRSSRNTKQPNYSIEKYLVKEHLPHTKLSKKKKVKQSEELNATAGAECKKCGYNGTKRFVQKMDHVMSHTDLNKYECVADGCGHKSRYKNTIKHHMKTRHPKQLNKFRDIQLNREQTIEFDMMFRECFGSTVNDTDRCQICWYRPDSKRRFYSLGAKREHSLIHLDFMQYKCMEPGCGFESKSVPSMVTHLRTKGKWSNTALEENLYSKIQLSEAQELEVEEIFAKSFPDLQQNENPSSATDVTQNPIATEEGEESISDSSDDELIGDDSSDASVSNRMAAASASTTRRSSRKKPNYSSGEDSEEDYTPRTKNSKKIDSGSNSRGLKRTACNKCGAVMDGNYATKLLHVRGPTHADIKKFKCGGCSYKCAHSGNMTKHMKAYHPTRMNDFEEIPLTRNQEIELETMIKKCFGSSENDANKCQVCWHTVSSHRNCVNKNKLEHSLTHIDFMLYKCREPGCTFESKTLISMNTHWVHKKSMKNVAKKNRYSKIELTREQELESKGMFDKCFPDLEQNQNPPSSGTVGLQNHIGHVASPQKQVKTPSSSASKRPSRKAKRPNDSIDKDNDEDHTPSTKKLKKNDSGTNGKNAKKTTCNKCGAVMTDDYETKMLHVRSSTHMNIMKFKCIVGSCEYSTLYRGNNKKHMKFHHPTQLNAFEEVSLTRDQSIEFESMMRVCFGLLENDEHKCQICFQNIGGNSSSWLSMKQDHSLSHVDFMIYKCMESGCTFESRTKGVMKMHSRFCGKKQANNVSKEKRYSNIELTEKQNLEAASIFAKCFPNLTQNRNAP